MFGIFAKRRQDYFEQTQKTCKVCAHFKNAPAYLERVIPGLNSMSSGYASVRRDDGICVLHDIYLAAHSSCEAFTEAK
jgi:hypothetical protein